ncbi:MAPEG family protein [Roseateles asaccharophilus]|uniref:MAPEG superfamily protein n=1 Tax=Roseateles asaccharophilus TaxID=582607 RepID=A0ABU2A2Y6_9BURK|nr:MAPEG family protein [Roseateles asaccharophilus]MDR7331552.1 putative MAPEG superfamily protein [Roseateles asaccharophilus]
MTIAQFCLLVVCVLPVACAALAKSKGMGKRRRDGGFDNHNPREWLAKQQGWQARAHAAQANGWEALPIFLAALFVAHQHQVAQATVDALAMGFLAARLVYIGLYLADQPWLRSLAWFAGLAACVALFVVR